ncbi:unnamed protein product, partial [Prorocentrum cordatum]
MAGVVTCLEPLEVRPHGISESLTFLHVEAADDGCADEHRAGPPGMDTDLRALDMAKMCLQQGMPQLAKVFMDTVRDEAGHGGQVRRMPPHSQQASFAALSGANSGGRGALRVPVRGGPARGVRGPRGRRVEGGRGDLRGPAADSPRRLR